MSTSQRTILHIDGDAFFVACEVAKNPSLKGKPVIVGSDKGIATAMSYEAKKLGVVRAMPVFQIRKLWPHIIVLPSNFDLYQRFSQRMVTIVARHARKVEEYSVDECFADITGHESLARTIKDDLETSLNITFSVGVAPTKVLAKLASKMHKPAGFTVLNHREDSAQGTSQKEYIDKVSIGSVWGIGRTTAMNMHAHGIYTVGDFMALPHGRVQELFNRPMAEIWHELHGTSVFDIVPRGEQDLQQSIQHTRTFVKPTLSEYTLMAEISHHVEEVCSRARGEGLAGKVVSVFLKTRAMEYHRIEITLPHHTAVPQDILPVLRERWHLLHRPRTLYRSSGVTLRDLRPAEAAEQDLFGATEKSQEKGAVFAAVDKLARKFGEHAVILASSLEHFRSQGMSRPDAAPRVGNFKNSIHMGVASRDYYPLPYLGEVR